MERKGPQTESDKLRGFLTDYEHTCSLAPFSAKRGRSTHSILHRNLICLDPRLLLHLDSGARTPQCNLRAPGPTAPTTRQALIERKRMCRLRRVLEVDTVVEDDHERVRVELRERERDRAVVRVVREREEEDEVERRCSRCERAGLNDEVYEAHDDRVCCGEETVAPQEEEGHTGGDDDVAGGAAGQPHLE